MPACKPHRQFRISDEDFARIEKMRKLRGHRFKAQYIMEVVKKDELTHEVEKKLKENKDSA